MSQIEGKKSKTNPHHSSSMDKAGGDHCADNSYHQPDRAKDKES